MFYCRNKCIGLCLVVLGSTVLLSCLFPSWLLLCIEGFIIVVAGCFLIRY